MTKKQKSFRFDETTIQMLNLITQSNKLYKDNTHTLENIILKAFLQEINTNNLLLENIQDVHPDVLRLAQMIATSNQTNKPEV